MNRLLTLALIGLAGFMASCGSSATSSTQPGTNIVYTVVVSPMPYFTLNSGDWSTITAMVDTSYENGAPKAASPQPPLRYFSSDPRVTISPSGEVCAGQWDVRFFTCTPPSVIPAIDPTTGMANLNAGQPNLPTGYVTITAFDAEHNVSGTTLLSVHERAASIQLGVDKTAWNAASAPLGTCISQDNQVQYVATPYDATGAAISPTVSNVFANDYTWTVADPNVAQVSAYGFVAARNPGVTSVTASLNGTTSVPLTFVTCPPKSIVLSTSAYSGSTPLPPFTTADLSGLLRGTAEYVTASLVDTNGNPLVTSPLNYVTTNPLIGSFSPVLPLTSQLTANTSGRLSVAASCGPPNCNAAVSNFIVPNATTPTTGQAAGFGFPIYSNVIDVDVQGITGSTVLVVNSDQVPNALYRMDAYDSESLALTQTVTLANLPNSLVVSPNGATAYLGSSGGLVVVNLATFQSSVQTYPIVGGLSTDVITGTVLGVSPDSRYVVTSDTVSAKPNSYVFLIDTTGSKSATRYTIPGSVNAVTFAADGSNMWIGGTNGVYAFNASSFVQTAASKGVSANVNALAWMPDGQSYFASGTTAAAPMVNYSTCNDTKPQTPTGSVPTTVVGGLSTTVLQGVPHLLGLDGSTWFDYSVSTSAQVTTQTAQMPSALTPNGAGNVCLSTVTFPTTGPTITPATATGTLPCAATQVTFSPTLEQAFVTGVDPLDPSCTPESVIHGYSVANPGTVPATLAAAFTLPTTKAIIPLSGGALNDGRYLYVGSSDTTNGNVLHRIDLSSGTPTPGMEDTSISLELVPSFVAVVPK